MFQHLKKSTFFSYMQNISKNIFDFSYMGNWLFFCCFSGIKKPGKYENIFPGSYIKTIFHNSQINRQKPVIWRYE